jgi:hypothetical protein
MVSRLSWENQSRGEDPDLTIFCGSLLPFQTRNGVLKAKAVPLHATKALGWRGGIAITHSPPRHQMGWVVSVTPRPRFRPWERTLDTHCTGGWVGPRAGLDTRDYRKNPFASVRDRTSIVRSSSPNGVLAYKIIMQYFFPENSVRTYVYKRPALRAARIFPPITQMRNDVQNSTFYSNKTS